MTLNFEITKEDLIAFNLYFIRTNKQLRRTVLIMRLFGPFIFALTWALLFGSGKDNVYPGADTFLTAFLLTASVLWFFLIKKISLRKSLRKLSKFVDDPQNSNLVERREIIVEEEGVRIKTSNSDSFLGWNGIKSTQEESDCFYLFISTNQAHLIPKRAMTSEQINSLRTLIAEKRVPVNTISKKSKVK